MITFLSVLLVTLGVLAELNLLRIFLGDWRQHRREERSRPFPERFQARDIPSPAARRTMTGVAACFAGPLLISPVALGQEPGEIRGLGATDSTGIAADRRGWLSNSETEGSLSLQSVQPSTEAPKPAAQPLTISTNRPSFNDTTGIVPIGHFQLETGYTFTFRNRDGVETQTHNGPEILGRIPLLEDRLELQLGTSGYVWTRADSGSGFVSTEGFSDLTVGLRWKVIDQEGSTPRIALQASTTTGTGTEGISNQDVEPTFKFIWSYDLGSGWGIYGNLGVAYPTTSGERFVQGQAGVCLSYTINEKWSVYGEYYLFGPNSKGTDAAHYLDTGAAYLITPRIQLDGRVGFGLNQESNNVFTGFGISFLF